MSNPTHYDIIRSPVLSEKSTIATEQSKVVFNVLKSATKPQIKAAVEKLFDVNLPARTQLFFDTSHVQLPGGCKLFASLPPRVIEAFLDRRSGRGKGFR